MARNREIISFEVARKSPLIGKNFLQHCLDAINVPITNIYIYIYVCLSVSRINMNSYNIMIQILIYDKYLAVVLFLIFDRL